MLRAFVTYSIKLLLLSLFVQHINLMHYWMDTRHHVNIQVLHLPNPPSFKAVNQQSLKQTQPYHSQFR